MEKILKGYWDCPYCDSIGIDGLIDKCPTCGVQKPKEIKCYMKEGTIEYVSEEELNAAGITIEECDGNHPDWVCNYCDQLNDYSEPRCTSCGADRAEATHLYGMKPIEKDEISSNFDDTNNEPVTTDEHNNNYTVENNSNFEHNNNLERNIEPDINKTSRHKYHFDKQLALKIGGITTALIAFISLIVFLFYPIKHTVSVTGVSWTRTVTVEEERTVKENGWHVPSGGRVYDKKTEFKEFVQVLDHYETVEETKTRQVISHYETVSETKTRQVISHYETEYTYRDNGNGTFSEIPHQKPVYTTETYVETHQEPVYVTETYIETHQEPVYRQDPVYATKYYYEIDKWFDVKDYTTSGNDHNVYWSNEYTLNEKERDTKRSESYIIHYSDNSSTKLNYTDWSNTKIGDRIIITKNRLGMIYSQEKSNRKTTTYN